ncbi:MAG: protein-methionine-sulfoxide reductase heme-binding subunit MsrQ [Burkholderiaceae bacterium]
MALTSDLPMARSNSLPARIAWFKIGVFLVALIPFLRLFWLGYQDELTANPIEFVTRSTGIWTLVFLCITLAVTPVRRLTGQVWLIRFRRMLGLFAFFYASVHFTTYVWFDQWFDVAEIFKDVFKRPFITAGFAAFVLMVPLAVTSNQWSMRWLKRRWQLLHQLIYLIAPIGLVHFWWHKSGKNDYFEPIIYAGVIALLLGLRLVWRQQARRAQKARAGDA